MSMANLTTWMIDQNSLRKLFGQELLVLPRDKAYVIETLECALSPENLHCDGEISRAEAQRKYQYLNGALTVARRAS
jgi:hypothetical protein